MARGGYVAGAGVGWLKSSVRGMELPAIFSNPCAPPRPDLMAIAYEVQHAIEGPV
jgi:hypothetical protein